jgi:hypothetical protein
MKRLAGAITLVLCAALFMQWRNWPPPLPSLTMESSAPDLLPVGGPPTLTLEPMPPVEEYASIAERPLFLPDRRPPPDEPEVIDEPEPEALTELAGTDLNAVVITPSTVSAWLRRPKSPELVRVRLGDDFEGWTITGIEPDRLLLERQGETDELILRDYQNAPPQIPPTRRGAVQLRERLRDAVPSDGRRTESGRPPEPRSEPPPDGSATPDASSQSTPTGPSRTQSTTDARRLSR